MEFITAKQAYERSCKNSTIEEEKEKIAAEVFEEINKSIQKGRFSVFFKPSKITPEYTEAITKHLQELLERRGFYYEITKMERQSIEKILVDWSNIHGI